MSDADTLVRMARSHPWVHAIAMLRGWWLPGDERGFRSRDHRIHSSGDYKHRPPSWEHIHLRNWAERVSKDAEPALNQHERSVAGAAFVEKLIRENLIPLAVACAATHVHALFRASDIDALKALGKAKQLASLRVARRSGRIWGRGGGVDRIADREHQVRVFRYILRHRAEGAWVWCFKNPDR